MIKNILVTGGCGFIGANLIPFLLKENYRVRILDNLSRGRKEFLGDSDVEIIEGDIRDKKAVSLAMKDIDAVIHLAAYGSVIESIQDPFLNFEINAFGTMNMLECANNEKVKKFIFASTGGALIGDATPPVNELSAPRPISPYGASKLAGEGYCSAYAGSHSLNTVMLRFGNIYGPISAHKKGAITVFCKALLKDIPIEIYGDGSASRDFLHVNDLSYGIRNVLKTELKPATVLHLATGEETTVKELAESLISAAGKPEHQIIFKSGRKGEVHRNFATNDLAKELINFNPEISRADGMLLTWEWFKQQGHAALDIETSDS